MDRLVVLNDLSEAAGGASALALLSASAFREKGIAVSLLCGDNGSNPKLRDAGVEIVGLRQARLTSSPVGRTLINGLYNRSAAALVSEWIGLNDTDRTVYHLHGWAQILSPSVFRALQPIRKRLLLSAHDFFLACPNGSFSFLKSGRPCPHDPLSLACVTSDCDARNYAHKLWRVARQTVQKSFYHPASSPPVLAVHAAMRPLLMRAGIPSGSIVTLPNPVRRLSAERITAEQNRDALFIGRLEDRKGPDLALAAARAAGVKLRVIGEGPRAASLKAAYPEMAFFGFLDEAALADQLRQARMLLMPSRYPEPFGLAAVEAMWSGVPVVVADTALLARDIVARDAGLACDPRGLAAFTQAIRTLADDDRTVAAMSENGFVRTRGLGSTEPQWIARLSELYQARLADQA